MDGGIGEAALMGAVIGGGSSAITGGDPLKGALMGGLTSGVMSGFGGLTVPGATDAPEWMNTVTGAQPTTTVVPSSGGITDATTNAFNIPGKNMIPGADSAINTAFNLPQSPMSSAVGDVTTGLQKPQWVNPVDLVKANPFTYGSIAATQALPGLMQPKGIKAPETEKYNGPLSKFRYDPNTYTPDVVSPGTPYRPVYAADGGLMDGGNQGIAGLSANPSFPMANQQASRYAVPSQMPVGATDVRMAHMAPTPMARGGIADLGGYSDGGRMLKGPGDGMSDSIPASIGGKQPARLADGEFVVPADVVSHLGNGSTDAGAKQLYSMMDKVRKARTGTKKQGKQINPNKYVPA